MAKLKPGKRRSVSSRAWLERQLSDPYVVRAKRDGYRSRAAYKLAEIDDKFHLLKPGARVVDLGAAPGGWSEIAARRAGAQRARDRARHSRDEAGRRRRISATRFSRRDRAGATQGDARAARADVVLSDMAANATGHRQTDHLRIMALAEAAAVFAREVLAPGGAFLCKVLQGGTEASCWPNSSAISPPSSTSNRRQAAADSAELYLLAQGISRRRRQVAAITKPARRASPKRLAAPPAVRTAPNPHRPASA